MTPRAPAPSTAAQTIIDGSTGFNPHFFFLPPIVPPPNASGEFDPHQEPRVEICEWDDGCVAPNVAVFTVSSGTGSETVRVEAENEHYIVNWHTDASELAEGATYRISTYVGVLRMGTVDVQVVGSAREIRDLAGDVIPLVNGRTLPIKFRIESGALRFVGRELGESGGDLQLPGFGSLSVPSGTLSEEQAVRLHATQSPVTATEFLETVPVTDALRTPWELRLEFGREAPSGESTLRVVIPGDFEPQLAEGLEIALWAQVFQDSDLDLFDGFVRVPAELDETNGSLVATLSPHVFTTRRRSDGVFEAIFVLGAAPGPGAFAAAGAQDVVTVSQQQCEGAPLSPPLAGELSVNSPFNGTSHFGVDYAAANGIPVFAAAEGVIERIGLDERPLEEPDPRSGLLVKGWGRYVRLRHEDGSATRYAHMIKESTDHLSVGDAVAAGQQIGLADNTGGSTAPHLHLEQTTAGGVRIDSHACIAVGDADFAGIWEGTYFGEGSFGRIGPGEWTWTLLQSGTDVTGSVIGTAGETGDLSGSVTGTSLTLIISYPNGATNAGTLLLTGETMTGSLLLATPSGFNAEFSTTLSRQGAIASSPFRNAPDPASVPTYLADGTPSTGGDP